MSVIVDTPVWSLALRRRRKDLSRSERRLVTEWAGLVQEDAVMLVGPVRQELLSGIKEAATFERLRRHLRAFDDEPLTGDDFEAAARCCDRCRAAGVAASSIDYSICAVAFRHRAAIFTTDSGFARYARLLPIRLHEVGARPLEPVAKGDRQLVAGRFGHCQVYTARSQSPFATV
jgi:predicted nucleic acid-binding protein